MLIQWWASREALGEAGPVWTERSNIATTRDLKQISSITNNMIKNHIICEIEGPSVNKSLHTRRKRARIRTIVGIFLYSSQPGF